jgi:hypothetical protein
MHTVGLSVGLRIAGAGASAGGPDLQNNVLDEPVDGVAGKGQAVLEAPQHNAALREDGEKVQHAAMVYVCV